MTGSIPPAGPLAYEGQVVVPFIMRTFDPQTGFNQFPVPTIWINTATSTAFILVSKALGVAIWLNLGGSSGTLDTITTPDSTVVTPTAGNINFLNGTGVTITGSGSNITFNSMGGGLTWNDVSGLTQTLAPGNGYVADNGAQVTFSLPATAAFGDSYIIAGFGSGGWTLAQNAGQKVIVGNLTSTIGATGSVTSTLATNSIELTCVAANTTFKAINWQGNLTVA